MDVYVCLCVYVSVDVYGCVCVYENIYIHVCIYTLSHARTRTQVPRVQGGGDNLLVGQRTFTLPVPPLLWKLLDAQAKIVEGEGRGGGAWNGLQQYKRVELCVTTPTQPIQVYVCVPERGHTFERVRSHIRVSGVVHGNESGHICEWGTHLNDVIHGRLLRCRTWESHMCDLTHSNVCPLSGVVHGNESGHICE